MTLADHDLLRAAADVAHQKTIGQEPSPAVLACLKAIASTRSEQQRIVDARNAEALAGNITAAALRVLRVAIFGLPA